jgi:RNA polymerase sigma-70 factor (ECF subfamily)
MRIEDMQARAAAEPDPERIRQALETLPPGLRVAVVLKYMENLSVQEIAETLSIGVSAVKMRLARGREQLLDRLGPQRQRPEDERDAGHH